MIDGNLEKKKNLMIQRYSIKEKTIYKSRKSKRNLQKSAPDQCKTMETNYSIPAQKSNSAEK